MHLLQKTRREVPGPQRGRGSLRRREIRGLGEKKVSFRFLFLSLSCPVSFSAFLEKGRWEKYLTCKGPLAAVGVQDLGAPALIGAAVRVLGNLEPGARAVGSGGVVDLGHVDHDGAVVVAADGLGVAAAVAGLLVHLHSKRTAGCGFSSMGCSSWGEVHERLDLPATEQVLEASLGLALQRMSLEVTSVTGLLLWGMRTQVSDLSSVPTHMSWKVAWAETTEAVAKMAKKDFMVMGKVGIFESVGTNGKRAKDVRPAKNGVVRR